MHHVQVFIKKPHYHNLTHSAFKRTLFFFAHKINTSGGVIMKRNNNHVNKVNMYSIHDLFKDKKLEIVAAALLLTGKLKVDSVEIFRDSPVVNVTLIGQYKH